MREAHRDLVELAEQAERGKAQRKLVRLTKIQVPVAPHPRVVNGKVQQVRAHTRTVDVDLTPDLKRPSRRWLRPKAPVPRNVREAQEAVREVVGEDKDLPDIMRGVERAWSEEGPDPEVISQVEEQWHKVQDEPRMGKAIDRFGPVAVWVADRRFSFFPEWQGGKTSMQASMTNPAIMTFYDKGPGRNYPPDVDTAKPGGPVVSGGMAGVLRHEYGHHVLDQMHPGLRKAWEEAWFMLAISIAFQPRLSDYAFNGDLEDTGAHEGFAEVFSALMHPEFDREAYRGVHGEELLGLAMKMLWETKKRGSWFVLEEE